MKYNFLKEKISKGAHASRKSWGSCKVIRAAVDADYDFINYPVQGLFVTDCILAECDCRISIYNPSEDDLEAEDWEIRKAQDFVGAVHDDGLKNGLG